MGRTPQAGFTLIEILVVMVIIGILASMATLVLVPQDSRAAENEARRLLAILQMASEEAVLQSMEIGLDLDADRFLFRGYHEGDQKWVELPQSFLQEGRPAEGVVLTLNTTGSGFRLKRTERSQVEEEETPFLPRILLLSSGETTPFELQFRTPDERTRAVETWRLQSDGFNPIQILAPGEENPFD